MSERSIVIGLAGDVLVDRDNPPEVFDRIAPTLRATDLLFANLEGPYSDHPHLAPSVGVAVIPPAHNLDVYAPAGFNVVSMANNHIVDAGHRAMLETRQRLNDQGIKTCGVGTNLSEARLPAIVETNGLKVAFLAYASVFPHGYEARSNVPGLAPMRAYNHYHEAYPNYFIPGTPPRVETIPDQTDLANLREDIALARGRADLVVTSFHWGDFMVPHSLTDHEMRTARICIDAGADMVVGHHHHILRGIEWYAGKPIFYGLGHFVFDCRIELSEEMQAKVGGDVGDLANYGIGPRVGWPLLPLHAESRMTALGWATVTDGVIDGVGFLPCRLNPEGQVYAVDPNTAEGAEVVEYVWRGCESQGLNARFERDSAPDLAGNATIRVVPAD